MNSDVVSFLSFATTFKRCSHEMFLKWILERSHSSFLPPKALHFTFCDILFSFFLDISSKREFWDIFCWLSFYRPHREKIETIFDLFGIAPRSSFNLLLLNTFQLICLNLIKWNDEMSGKFDAQFEREGYNWFVVQFIFFSWTWPSFHKKICVKIKT